ncbi:MAG: carbonic anhydrase [Dehalococcoidia bacterium]|nr:carbonic anhydrase [Dehalococcoidia bacterium]
MHGLIAGNKRFISKIDRRLLEELSTKGQKPQALVVSCSDSRVPPEIIFDATVPGTLFVVRVAGNVVSGPTVIGSIEYAVQHLKVPAVVLLGHAGCGAVKARIDGAFEHGRLAQLCKAIHCHSRDLDRAVIENLEYQFGKLLKIDCVRKGVRDGRVQAYAMTYDLSSGRVSILKGTTDKPDIRSGTVLSSLRDTRKASAP